VLDRLIGLLEEQGDYRAAIGMASADSMDPLDERTLDATYA
jgi:hypothetical protein